MRSLYLLAHCDDEYAAWPLLRADRAAGRAVAIVHLTAPKDPRRAARRRAESCRFVAGLDLPNVELIDLAAETGAQDGRLLGSLEASLGALLGHFGGAGRIERITTPAWEGGHIDHDLAAALAVALAAQHAPRPALRQISLYHGAGLPGPLFHTGPLPQSGPVQRLELSLGETCAFALAARAYPSQAAVFTTWWPSLFGAYLRRGYEVQALTPERVRARPHEGPLLYERRGHGDYASVARRVEALLDHAARLASAAATPA